jgi:hypothetical protein
MERVEAQGDARRRAQLHGAVVRARREDHAELAEARMWRRVGEWYDHRAA